MQKNLFCLARVHDYPLRKGFTKMLLVMKLIVILMTFSFVSLHAHTYGQTITFSGKDVPLAKVFSAIRQQTGYVVFTSKAVLSHSRPVTLSMRDAPLTDFLGLLFKDQPLSYRIADKTIMLSQRTESALPLSANASDIDLPPPATIRITGQVTDSATNRQMPGVSIRIKGTGTGTVTDTDGHYAIEAPENATLVFTFLGYQQQEIPVTGESVINVIMRASSEELDKVVVTGYTSQKKALITGSIVTLDNVDELKILPSAALGDAIAGKMAGVNVSTPQSVPGNQPGISVRTVSSWNPQPVLYIIDGKISSASDFNNLSPNEVQEISVLKDAAAAAIYGSRAAGGVFLITTKRGRKGKPVIEFSYNSSIDKRPKGIALTSAVQAAELYNRVTTDPGWAWSQEEIDFIKTVNNGWGYDQLDAIWHTPTITNYNLGVSGGGDKVSYFVGGSYVKQQSFFQPLHYKKYNVRVNITADLSKDFQLFAGLGLNNDVYHEFGQGGPGLYGTLLRWQPDFPVFINNTDKPYDYGWIGNIGSMGRGDGGYITRTHLNPQINLSARYNLSFIPGLSAKASYSGSFAFDKTKNFQKNYPMYVLQKSGSHNHIIHNSDTAIVSTRMATWASPPGMQEDVGWGQDYQLDLQLNYERTFNSDHHIQALLVYEKYQQSTGGVTAGIQNFPIYTTDQWWAASGSRQDSYVYGPTDATSGRISYVGQLNYNYKEKYLASFSYREDGSMNFAPDKRWGFFPAGSLGWIVSKEPFLSDSRTIDFLKLRFSAGLTGNDAVGGWQWQESYHSGAAAFLGVTPKIIPGITYGSVVNPALTWEKSLTYNVGIDMNYHEHWQATAEYWFRKTYDILGPRTASVPPTFSLSLPSENYGQINAQGVELTLGYHNRAGNFNYHANLTTSYGWNKVIRRDYPENARPIDIPEGKSTTYFVGLLSNGIIRTQADLDKYTSSGYKYNGIPPALGQLVYKDVSSVNGTPDGIIDVYDRVVLRKNNFPIVYGLNLGGSWKGFAIDMMLNGYIKQYKNFENLAENVEWNRMWVAWYNNSWTPDNPNAMLPKRISINDRTDTYRNSGSDFWFKDASFGRLKYLNLSYTLPVKWYNKYGLDDIKFFFSGTNLFVLSDFKYYDPELGTGLDYPIMRSFSFGADIKF